MKNNTPRPIRPVTTQTGFIRDAQYEWPCDVCGSTDFDPDVPMTMISRQVPENSGYEEIYIKCPFCGSDKHMCYMTQRLNGLRKIANSLGQAAAVAEKKRIEGKFGRTDEIKNTLRPEEKEFIKARETYQRAFQAAQRRLREKLDPISPMPLRLKPRAYADEDHS